MKTILWSANHRFIVEIYDGLGLDYCIVHFVGVEPYRTETVQPMQRYNPNTKKMNYNTTFREAVEEFKKAHRELFL